MPRASKYRPTVQSCATTCGTARRTPEAAPQSGRPVARGPTAAGWSTRPTPSRPAIDRLPPGRADKTRECPSRSGYALAGRLVASVRTRSAWNPGSTDISREKLRMSKPPAASSTTASANCAVTSVPNSRRCRTPAGTAASPFLQRFIGAAPRRFPRRAASRTEARSAPRRRLRTPAPSRRCRFPPFAESSDGATLTRTPDPHHARSTPSTPPPSASSADSTSTCRISRARLAPSAARTAISRPREAARVSIRLAMSAHAIRRTHATATSSTYSVVSMRPTVSSRIGVADADRLNPP